MNFGIYVHIPYCLQRCSYCDFATYEHSQILPPEQYIDLLKEEIQQTEGAHPKGTLTSLYFGGGTPSLIEPSLIVSIIDTLANCGFKAGPQTEITLEINPATIDERKMELYLKAQVNRFSVGAQTFNDRLLKLINRKHDAKQTRQTISLLRSFGVVFSLDLLFALPTQSLEDLKLDLDEVLSFQPHHISPYCLTVAKEHSLYKQQPQDEIQLRMFDEISDVLKGLSYQRYEISNFCRDSYESKHNSLYWNNSPYWGLGLGAHSYAPSSNFDPKFGSKWGIRYWNSNSIESYKNQINLNRDRKFIFPAENLPQANKELLQLHQAVTDFCHTSLRTRLGLSLEKLHLRFGPKVCSLLKMQLKLLEEKTWLVEYDKERWRLSEQGLVLSNQVFSALTFLNDEINDELSQT